jgi:hypothetical protein
MAEGCLGCESPSVALDIPCSVTCAINRITVSFDTSFLKLSPPQRPPFSTSIASVFAVLLGRVTSDEAGLAVVSSVRSWPGERENGGPVCESDSFHLAVYSPQARRVR